MCSIVDEDGRQMTAVSNFDNEWNIRELDAGDEVFVNYANKSGFQSSPVEVFIDYGFVPEELLETTRDRPIDIEDFDDD